MEKIEIVIEYVAEDEKYRDMILTWLEGVIGPWKQQKLVSIWHRGLILAGQALAKETDKHRQAAKLFLFLVSADFIFNEFYDSPAMHDLIRRHNAGDICIVPIILRPTLWDTSPFGTITSLPSNKKPLNSWGDKDAAMLNIAQGIKKIVESLLAPSATEETAPDTNQESISMSQGSPSHASSTPARCEVVILTALAVEYSAVLEHLQSPQHELVHPSGTIYQQGNFVGDHRTWSVAVVEVGMGGPQAAAETEKAISYLNPSLVLFVGIAGGIKDVSRGDVVAATKIYAYESGKAGRHFEPRPEVWRASHALEQRARAEARNPAWLNRLPYPSPRPQPRVFVGPIAAGEKVLASTQTSTYNLLKSTYGDTLAVDMEGHGFLQAVQVNQSVLGLVIRGISDLIDDKSDPTAPFLQATAAHHAAAFAFQILAKFQSAQPASVPTPLPPSIAVANRRRGQQINNLQSEYELWNQKLSRLKHRRAIETDEEVLFKLDITIKETQENHDRLLRELEQLEQQA